MTEVEVTFWIRKQDQEAYHRVVGSPFPATVEVDGWLLGEESFNLGGSTVQDRLAAAGLHFLAAYEPFDGYVGQIAACDGDTYAICLYDGQEILIPITDIAVALHNVNVFRGILSRLREDGLPHSGGLENG